MSLKSGSVINAQNENPPANVRGIFFAFCYMAQFLYFSPMEKQIRNYQITIGVLFAMLLSLIVVMIWETGEAKRLYKSGREVGMKQYKVAVLLYKDQANPSVDIDKIDNIFNTDMRCRVNSDK